MSNSLYTNVYKLCACGIYIWHFVLLKRHWLTRRRHCCVLTVSAAGTWVIETLFILLQYTQLSRFLTLVYHGCDRRDRGEVVFTTSVILRENLSRSTETSSSLLYEDFLFRSDFSRNLFFVGSVKLTYRARQVMRVSKNIRKLSHILKDGDDKW